MKNDNNRENICSLDEDHVKVDRAANPAESELDLIARRIQEAIQAGNVAKGKEDFRLLMRSASTELLWMARQKVSDEEDAKDIVAKVYFDLFQALEKAEPVRAVRALMRTLVTRRTIDFWRERSGTGSGAARTSDGRWREREMTQDTEFWVKQDNPLTSNPLGETSEEIDSRLFAEIAVPRILERLRPEHREILVLRHMYGLDTKLAAATAGITIDVAKKRLRDALAAATRILDSLNTHK